MLDGVATIWYAVPLSCTGALTTVTGFPAKSVPVIVTVPVYKPLVMVEKSTWMVQLAPLFNVVPQLLGTRKLFRVKDVPLTVITIFDSGPAPAALDSVKLWVARTIVRMFPKLYGPAVTLAFGRANPVPVSPTVRVGLAGSLLAMVIDAVFNPTVVGWKVTLIVQLAPTANGETQGLVIV